MAWCRTGHKPLSKAIVTLFICVVLGGNELIENAHVGDTTLGPSHHYWPTVRRGDGLGVSYAELTFPLCASWSVDYKHGHIYTDLLQICMHACIHTHTHTCNFNSVDVLHYIDVIMTTVASQIISLTIVYSIVYSGADQRKHQSSAPLAFVRGIHRDRWIPRSNGQLRGKCFHLMTSSWNAF